MLHRLPSLDAYDMADVSETEVSAYPDDQRDAWEAWTEFEEYAREMPA